MSKGRLEALTPFVTSWMGETSFAGFPVAAYGAVFWLVPDRRIELALRERKS